MLFFSDECKEVTVTEIVYVEVRKRDITIVTDTGIYPQNKIFSEFEKLLPPGSYLRISRQVVVIVQPHYSLHTSICLPDASRERGVFDLQTQQYIQCLGEPAELGSEQVSAVVVVKKNKKIPNIQGCIPIKNPPLFRGIWVPSAGFKPTIFRTGI